MDIFPSADYYEREIHDFFGVEFEGNPKLHLKLFLADDWKEKPPLLKDWKQTKTKQSKQVMPVDDEIKQRQQDEHDAEKPVGDSQQHLFEPGKQFPIVKGGDAGCSQK